MAAVTTIKATAWLTDLGKGDLCAPFFDANNTLHFCLQKSGDILSVSQLGVVKKSFSTGGQPSAAVFLGDRLLVTDLAHGAVLALTEDGGQDIVCSVYEDKPLKGPSSIAIGSVGCIFFTDSGALGETGLHSPTGSVFCVTPSQILKPISLNFLASPSAIVCSGKFLFVAELMTNRVLRYFQQPEGVFHGSVWYQLSGGVGPSALAVDAQGSLYVGVYDTKESSTTGTVLVLSSSGKLVSTISTAGPEISGLVIGSDNNLYVTEKSAGSIYKVPL